MMSQSDCLYDEIDREAAHDYDPEPEDVPRPEDVDMPPYQPPTEAVKRLIRAGLICCECGGDGNTCTCDSSTPPHQPF